MILRAWPLLSTVALLVWLAIDIVWIGWPISAREGRIDEWLHWAAMVWLVFCVGTRPLVASRLPTPMMVTAVTVALSALPIGMLLTPIPAQSTMLGDLVLAGSAGLFAWSAATLGRCFTIFPASLGFCHRGPYRFVRHPMYAAFMIGSVGVFLYLPHPIIAAAVVVEGAALFVRATLEEAVLTAEIPGYLAYMQRTPGRFMPRLSAAPVPAP